MPVYIAILVFATIIGYMGKNQFEHNNHEAVINQYGVKMNISKPYAFFCFALLIFFATMRSDFVDSSSYIATFNALGTGLDRAIEVFKTEPKSPLFHAANVLFKTYISDNYSVWLFFYTVLYVIAIVKLFFTFSCDYTYSVFLLIVTADFTWVMNGMKQMTAATLVYFAISFVLERKLFKFAVIVGIAYFFHQTVLIWLVIYFFATGKPWSKKTGIFIVGTIGAVLFLSSFTNVLDSLLEDTAYGNATSSLTGDSGMNPFRFAVNAVPAALAFYRRRELEEHLTPAMSMCINLSVVTASIYFIAVFTSGILVGRLPGYFSFFNYILLPWIFKYGFKEEEGKTFKLFCTFGYLAYFVYNILFANLQTYGSEKLDLFFGVDKILK